MRKFEFSKFKDLQKNKNINNDFLEWLIGFFEADGNFIIDSKNTISFKITQNSVNKHILYYIQNNLGFGSVIKQGPRTHCFIINNLKDIYKILILLNGNLILISKKRQFLRILKSFNNKAGIININYIDYNLKPSLDNAWISGFTDAKGNFNVSFLRGTHVYRIRFILSQKGIENLPILSNLILNFNAGIIESHSIGKQNYSFIIDDIKYCKTIIPYFNKFPLKTLKLDSWRMWSDVLDKIEEKQHLNSKKLLDLIEKAKQINKIQKSTYF